MTFDTTREAVEFLASRIAEEASSRHIPLSDRERRTLFSLEGSEFVSGVESGDASWTDEDDGEFIAKIPMLSKQAYQRYRETSPKAAQQWREAVKTLKKHDHELGMLVYVPRPSADIAMLIVAALGVIVLMMAVTAGLHWIDGRVHIQFSDTTSVVAVITAFALLYYLTWSKTAKRLGERMITLLGDAVDRVFRRL